MVPNFPSPVLSIAADALRDLDGADAVTGLWSTPPPPLTNDTTSSFFSATPPPLHRLFAIPPKPNFPVGRIICDMIPLRFDLPSIKPPTRPPRPKLDPVIVPPDLVVNPTPHPTPPATPVPPGPSTPLPSIGQHLAPPPRLSAAVARNNSPDATTPSNLAPIPPASLSHILAPVPIAPVAQPHPNSRLDPHPRPHPSQRPHRPPQPLAPHPVHETVKLSDRRFFLQQDQSPSPERDGPDRGSNGSISTGKSPSETGELQPSSVTSNQTRASAASGSSHPVARGRRSKNPPSRPVLTRLNSGRHIVQATRKDPTKARPPFHPNPDKAPKVAGPSRQPRPPLDPLPHPPPAKVQTRHMNGATAPSASNTHAATTAAPRRGIVVSNTSSEYETTDTDEDDDDSWASEGVSEGAVDATEAGTDKRPPTKEDIKLGEAALEAQRQRELFVKQPKRSYSNLGRTQSGLLSQLLNPDPNMFPPGHPSRVTSPHDVTRPGMPSALTSGKATAAIPLAAQVTAQAPMATATSSTHGGYRPKGRPQGEELEDDSDSPDDPDDSIQVSRSLAQQRLAALANPSRRRASDNQVQTQASAVMRPILPTVATAPIPLNHPWNLPTPAPPTTPRTTRRQMLSTELSESLRRNLLWERQVSKTNLLGNAGRRNVLGGGGSRPLPTTVNGNGTGYGQAGPPHQPQPQPQPQQRQQRPASGEGAEDSIAERRQRALARNRTWADDFHYAGW
ncbi:hypothetical protein F5148DRAFT_1312270 [Russula earlei]|uniref:Uncharacterized protein n=1 Tax=Russula earlei TaxID=71964 RepID=A0ACC0UM83_9AGAM|nr:hypothetical protein F5148DRAFT_1312270 [Russula earlei]